MDWERGSLDKTGIWSFYIAANAVGCVLCVWAIVVSVRKPHKTSFDVLICGLCSACFWLSATCGSQCLLSVIHHYFYGQSIACQLEAFFHVSAILSQFAHVTAIAVRSYVSVRWSQSISTRRACQFVALIWFLCIGLTFVHHSNVTFHDAAARECLFAIGDRARYAQARHLKHGQRTNGL